jgi:hypothetical protein
MTKYIATGFCVFAAILLWNVVLIERDKELFNAYDSVCKQHSNHYQCRYLK